MARTTTKKVKRRTAQSRLTRELLETARDMRSSGLMTKVAHDKITMRHKGDIPPPRSVTLTGPEIRALREQAHLSQAVFARYLNLTVGYVSQLERGAKRPSGPALVLLDVIRRKGIGAIL
jgi:putative transcriptional regulator